MGGYAPYVDLALDTAGETRALAGTGAREWADEASNRSRSAGFPRMLTWPKTSAAYSGRLARLTAVTGSTLLILVM